MSAAKRVFTHQQFQAIADAGTNRACAGLLEGLCAVGKFQAPRAVLYRADPNSGLRTALCLDFGGPLSVAEPLAGYFGLWLVESKSRIVACHGCQRAPSARAIGGRVVHNLPVLDPSGDWVDQLAAALARAQVGAAPGDPDGAWGLASPFGMLARVERNLLQAALTSFCAELDSDVLAAVHAEGVPAIAVYNHYWAGGSRQHRNRVQAALTHPRFSGLLRNDWQLRRTVDAGGPLTQALAERFQVRVGTIQRTRRLGPACIAPDALAPVLKRVDSLPAGVVPAGEADWAVFLGLHDGIEALAQATASDLGRFLNPFSNGWRAGLDALERKLQGPLDLDGVFEMMHCAYGYGVRPAVQEALVASKSSATVSVNPPAGFFPLWFGRYGLVRLAQMAGQWREAHGRFSIERLGAGAHLGEDGSLAWPGLLPAGASSGNLRVIELTSRQALDLEGRRLDHCVASYAIKCLMADSCIFSIRGRSGQPLSTFEVRLPTVGPAQLLRHHAAGNAKPGAELEAVAQRFVSVVLARVPRTQIASVQTARRTIGLRLGGLLGKPNVLQRPLTPEELHSLAGAIAFAHPSETKRLGIVPFMHDCGRQVLGEMLTA